jgi:hypothetical protein
VIDIRLHSYLLAHAEGNGAERVGPLVASFDAHSAHPYRNYAIPDDQACPDAGQVGALIAAFTARGRTPRLEYLPGLCPAVEPACSPPSGAWRSRPPGRHHHPILDPGG